MCRAGSARGNGRFEHGTVLSSGGEGLDRSSSGQADRGGHDAPGNALGAACQARSLLFAGEPVTGAAKRAEAVVSQEASTVRRPSPRPSSGCCAVYNTALAGRLRVCCAPQTVVWFLQYASVMSLLSPPVQQSVQHAGIPSFAGPALHQAACRLGGVCQARYEGLQRKAGWWRTAAPVRAGICRKINK